MRSERLVIGLLMAAAALLGAEGAEAQEATMVIKLLKTDACTIQVGDIELGTTAGGSAIQGSADVTVECAKDVKYQLGLDAGAARLSGGPRRLYPVIIGATEHIPYYLYTDAAHTQEWGDTDHGDTYPAPAFGGTGAGYSQIFRIYAATGAIPAGIPAGEYRDVIKVSLNL